MRSDSMVYSARALKLMEFVISRLHKGTWRPTPRPNPWRQRHRNHRTAFVTQRLGLRVSPYPGGYLAWIYRSPRVCRDKERAPAQRGTSGYTSGIVTMAITQQ